jgi:hypothetical protein
VVEPVTLFPVERLDRRDRLYVSLKITQQLRENSLIRLLADGSDAKNAPEVGVQSLNELCLPHRIARMIKRSGTTRYAAYLLNDTSVVKCSR